MNFGGNKLDSHYNKNTHPIKEQRDRPDRVAQACELSTQKDSEFETSLGSMSRPYLKIIIEIGKSCGTQGENHAIPLVCIAQGCTYIPLQTHA